MKKRKIKNVIIAGLLLLGGATTFLGCKAFADSYIEKKIAIERIKFVGHSDSLLRGAGILKHYEEAKDYTEVSYPDGGNIIVGIDTKNDVIDIITLEDDFSSGSHREIFEIKKSISLDNVKGFIHENWFDDIDKFYFDTTDGKSYVYSVESDEFKEFTAEGSTISEMYDKFIREREATKLGTSIWNSYNEKTGKVESTLDFTMYLEYEGTCYDSYEITYKK